MAGIVLETNLSRDKAFSAAAKAAQDCGLTVRHITERQFQAKRGNLTMSWLLPPVTPYCNFLISVLDGEQDDGEVVLQRNLPWWTGVFGVRGVQGMFDKLVDATQDAVEAAGGKVLRWREF